MTDDMAEDIELADLVPKIYEPIVSWDTLRAKLIQQMTKMNEEIRGSQMDLVFFKDAMIHLLRVSTHFSSEEKNTPFRLDLARDQHAERTFVAGRSGRKRKTIVDETRRAHRRSEEFRGATIFEMFLFRLQIFPNQRLAVTKNLRSHSEERSSADRTR